MKRPLWKRMLDLIALAICALACVGFAAHAILGDDGGGRVWEGVIAAALAGSFLRAAPLMLKAWRTPQLDEI